MSELKPRYRRRRCWRPFSYLSDPGSELGACQVCGEPLLSLLYFLWAVELQSFAPQVCESARDGSRYHCLGLLITRYFLHNAIALAVPSSGLLMISSISAAGSVAPNHNQRLSAACLHSTSCPTRFWTPGCLRKARRPSNQSWVRSVEHHGLSATTSHPARTHQRLQQHGHERSPTDCCGCLQVSAPVPPTQGRTSYFLEYLIHQRNRRIWRSKPSRRTQSTP